MEINFVAVFVAGIIAMVLGFVWYGPLFGKKWMELIGATPESIKSESQSKMMPLYALQFVLALIEAYVLMYIINGWAEVSGVEAAVWIFIGFIVPAFASAVMWTRDSTKMKMEKFAIQAGYHLLLLLVWSYMFQVWM